MKQGVSLSPLDSSLHKFPGAQIFIYKRLLISSSRNSSRWSDSRNSQRGPCTSDTQLDSLKVWYPRRKLSMRNRGYLRGRSGMWTQWSVHTENPLTWMTSWYKPDLTYRIQ